MKKKGYGFILIVILATSMLFAGGESETAEAKPLRVGTMAKAMGLPLKYALDQGYFSEKGLDVEIITFATGAPINEAMNANELDVAVSGMATVYNLATGNFVYIGDTMISEKGQALYVRPNSPVAKAGSQNGIIGSADTVKGLSILGPLSTSAQYNAIKYIEYFGLTNDDFSMVSMDYAQAYQAFITGKGDGIATIPPYSFQLQDKGMVEVASVASLMGQPLTDGIYVQKKLVKDRAEDLQILLEEYYRACQELLDDQELRKEVGMAWYAEEGVTYTESDMANEIMAQTYTTVDRLKADSYRFGTTMTTMGKFFSNRGLIDPDNLSNIENSFNTTFVEHLIGTPVKRSSI